MKAFLQGALFALLLFPVAFFVGAGTAWLAHRVFFGKKVRTHE